MSKTTIVHPTIVNINMNRCCWVFSIVVGSSVVIGGSIGVVGGCVVVVMGTVVVVLGSANKYLFI